MRVGLNFLEVLCLYILDEVIHAMLQHLRCEVAHDGVGLNMQLAEHRVGLSAAEEADDVVVRLSEHNHHGAAGP
jgi:hypothetical protein